MSKTDPQLGRVAPDRVPAATPRSRWRAAASWLLRTPAVAAMALVRLYRYTLSPMLPRSCRFHPSCSAYALEAIKVHGFRHGGWLAAKRIGRCHPWHDGGYDPVPRA